MTKSRYTTLAAYNAWANRRLYAASAQLSPHQYKEHRGAFFGSVHGTLNHLLVADRVWMRRFTGEGELAPRLDSILHDKLEPLRLARETEDARIIAFVAGLDGPALSAELSYLHRSGTTFTQPLDTALDHFFNHQTHHRGQVHALLSSFLGNDATPSLDMIVLQREAGLTAQR